MIAAQARAAGVTFRSHFAEEGSLESLAMPTANLHIDTKPGSVPDIKIMTLVGSLNIHTIFGFQEATRAETAPKLIIDFGGISYVDSAGLGALVGAYVAAQRHNRKLAVAGMNTQVKALVDMTQVGQLIKSYPQVADAEAALK
jgi:anti-sigma B factor antagonist